MNLEYLFSPTKQFTYPSGKLLDGGKIYVYFKDTENLATLYSPEGTFVSNPILLDANGRASVRADITYQYRLEIYTNKDVLLYTCEAFCEGDGSGGFSFVIHDETLSGNGTAANPLGVINIPLAVDETMTAYSAIVEEKESLVLGVNGDWFTNTFGSALDNKVDLSSFSACCSAVKGGLDNKLDISAFDLSNYYNKQETNNLLEQRVDRNEFTQTINWIDQNKQDKLTFDYNENSAISAINGSALAGQGGEGSCPWISGGKEIAEAQTLTANMLFQALSSFTLSGDHNHFISMKGGIYRFPNEWELASGIAITNYFMPQSSFSSYSASIAGDISTLYGQDGYFSGQINNLSGVLKSTSSTVNTNSSTWNDVISKQDKLTFGYNEDNEINSINNSAIAGGDGGDCPWISGGKIIEDTQLLTANMIIQTLSSFTVSGDKNHFISVKGGKYQFPNQWQLASAIDETYWFAKASALSSYTPLSAYTPTINDLYTSANWMMANKLDVSAYTGVQVETAYLPLSSLGDSVGSGNENVGIRCYAFGADNDVRGINDFVAGSANTANADRNTVIFGECNIGNKNVLVIGSGNSGFGNSLVLGQSCSSNSDSLSIGESAYSNWYSVGVGSSVYSNDYSLGIGRYASADYMAVAVGSYNSACYHSLAIGTQNTAEGYSMIAGDTNNGYMSIIAGGTNTGLSGSVVVGSNNGSGVCSLVIGNWNEGHTSGISVGTSNTGDMYSVIVGKDNKVGWKSMAIGNGLMLDKWSNGIAVGKYNKTSAACFVVGNGDADDDRRDLVVIDDNGIVSATNIVTPGGISLVDFYNAFTAYTANHQ